MSEQPLNPEPADRRRVIQAAAVIGKHTVNAIKMVLFIAPLVVVLVIIVLALLGPAIGNTFSNIVSSL